MLSICKLILTLLFVAVGVHAQFQFFQDFMGGGQQQQHQGHHHHQSPQDGPSDSNWYREQVDRAHCSKYLCPDTLACVAFPHHCPCPHPAFEDKVELQDGKAVCVSKGGFKSGEAARKIELARKGLI